MDIGGSPPYCLLNNLVQLQSYWRILAWNSKYLLLCFVFCRLPIHTGIFLLGHHIIATDRQSDIIRQSHNRLYTLLRYSSQIIDGTNINYIFHRHGQRVTDDLQGQNVVLTSHLLRNKLYCLRKDFVAVKID